MNSQHVSVLIIGTGISGLYAALKLSEAGVSVQLITKSDLAENNSRYAQGGIAAVLPQNLDDSLDQHVEDTVIAGAGLCDEAVTRRILSEAYDGIADLLRFGVPFDRNPDGKLALTLEAGHSVQRILHAGGDATGKSVEMTLIRRVKADPNITVMEHATVTQLLMAEDRCVGARVLSLGDRTETLIQADFTILATGGMGRIYANSTNPAGSTGDGLALAYEAGAVLKDLEFIQFHPTAFYQDGQVHFLISEALRGEGGILKNTQGSIFAKRYHPDGELAPRDIVARAIYTEIENGSAPHVWLDMTHLPTKLIEHRFPTILEACLGFGIDIRKEPIPVAPAAHYIMGGIAVDENAQSTLNGLYVIGESAQTGLHGANRLASNSLLECVVLARNAADHITGQLETRPHQQPALPIMPSLPYRFESSAVLENGLKELHRWMWQYVGIVRNEAGLQKALTNLKRLQQDSEIMKHRYNAPLGILLYQQLLMAEQVVISALERQESLGAHYRSDYPEPAEQPQHSIQQRPAPPRQPALT